MSTIYHKHHIIPRHMGGTDDPSNLVQLTVEEHAEAHRKLFEQYGKEEDKIAWMALSGQASKPESMRMASKLGRAKTDKILEERYGPDWRTIHAKHAAKFGAIKYKYRYQTDSEFRSKMESIRLAAIESARSPESNKKRKRTFAENKHQQGSNNSNFGKMWISNHTLQASKPHPKCDPIPEGWAKGRKLNW